MTGRKIIVSTMWTIFLIGTFLGMAMLLSGCTAHEAARQISHTQPVAGVYNPPPVPGTAEATSPTVTVKLNGKTVVTPVATDGNDVIINLTLPSPSVNIPPSTPPASAESIGTAIWHAARDTVILIAVGLGLLAAFLFVVNHWLAKTAFGTKVEALEGKLESDVKQAELKKVLTEILVDLGYQPAPTKTAA